MTGYDIENEFALMKFRYAKIKAEGGSREMLQSTLRAKADVLMWHCVAETQRLWATGECAAHLDEKKELCWKITSRKL